MKGKLLKTFKQFLIVSLIIVMLLPSFANAASEAVTNTEGFSVKKAFNNIMINLGISTPHQDTFTAWMDETNSKKIDDSISNYKSYYQAGDVLMIDVKFTGTINDISDDTKLVFKFGETGVERVLTKEDAKIYNNDWIQFSYTIKGPTYSGDEMTDKGDNGGLIFCYFLGNVYFAEDSQTTVYALPNDLKMYKNKIIADTISPRVEGDETSEDTVIANEKLYKYVPGEVTTTVEDKEVTDPESGETTTEKVEVTTDNREKGTIEKLEASDFIKISNKYDIVYFNQNDIMKTKDDGEATETEKFYLSDLKTKRLEELYIPMKNGDTTVMYMKANNDEDNPYSYYIYVKSAKNDKGALVCMDSFINASSKWWTGKYSSDNGEMYVQCNMSSLIEYLEKDGKTKLGTIIEQIASGSPEEVISINGQTIKRGDISEEDSINNASFFLQGIKQVLNYNDDANVANQKITLKYSYDNIYYENEGSFVSTSDLYKIYYAENSVIGEDEIPVLYYNICDGKYYFNISKSSDKVNEIDITEYVDSTIKIENESEIKEKFGEEDGVKIIEDAKKFSIFTLNLNHQLVLHITDMYVNKEFMKNNFEIDTKSCKNANGIELVDQKSEEKAGTITYTWTTCINGQVYSLTSNNKAKLEEKFVLKNLKAYLAQIRKETATESENRENDGTITTGVLATVTGETRMFNLTDDEVLMSNEDKTYYGLYFDKVKKEVSVTINDGGEEKTETVVGYFNTEKNLTTPIMYKGTNDKNETEYFLLSSSNEKVIVTKKVEYDSENNMYLNMSKVGGTYLSTYQSVCEYVTYTLQKIKFNLEDTHKDDEICAPNTVDIAGNSCDIHLVCLDDATNSYKKIDKIYEAESAGQISPVIQLTTEGKAYTEKISVTKGGVTTEEDVTIYFNKKSSKYTITALAHYRDGSIQVGFLNVTDPENTATEPTTFKNAKYISYNDATGMTTWEYEVAEGDQGKLFIKIIDCACDTQLYTPEKTEGEGEEKKVVEEAKECKIVEFKKYYADSIAPVVESLSVRNYGETWSNSDYICKTDLYGDVYTNVNQKINPTTGKEDIPDIELLMNISDETKMNKELSNGSYTSEAEDPRFSYSDVYTTENCVLDDNGKAVEYLTENIYEHKTDLSTEKYKDFMSKIKYDLVYRETETNKVILKEDLGTYSKGKKEYNYVEGDWNTITSTAVNYKIGEYINYIVDAKALKEGISKPVVKVTDYAGNESEYMINRLENTNCYYLILVDTTEPEYEVTRLVERTNEKTFECDVKYTDPTIDGYAGSGIQHIDNPEITNGKIIKVNKKEDDDNTLVYTIMPENDGYTKLYFGINNCIDYVNNGTTREELKQVYIDTNAPVIEDITGLPDTWVKEAEISVVAYDLSNFQYFITMAEPEMLQSVEPTYTDDNKYVVKSNGTLLINLKDELGNETVKTVEITKIDNTLPVITGVSVDGVSTTETIVTINATDDESQIAGYSFDGGENWQTVPTKSFNASEIIEKNAIQVKDNAGNIATYDDEVNIDITTSRTPIIKTNILYDYYTIPTGSDTATIYAEIEADGDNACELYYAVSKTLEEDFSKLDFNKVKGYNKYNQPIELTEGKWYIYMYAVDVVTGVESGIYYYETPIEIAKSEITFSPSSTDVTDKSIVVAINYGKGLTENRLAGFGNSREANLESVIVSENGDVYAEATDKAGNKVYATYKVENIRKITVDDFEEKTVVFDAESEDSKISKVIKSEEITGTNYIIIQPNVSLDELSDNIITNCEIKVMNADKSAEIKSDVDLSTGKVMTVSDLNEEYVIIVKGDVNGDGNVNMLDIIKINKARLNKVTLSDTQKIAADVNEDGKFNMLDIINVNKYRLRKVSKL